MSKSFGLINEKVDSFYRHVVRCQFVHYSFNGSERGSCAFRRGSTKIARNFAKEDLPCPAADC